jgi:chorismate synthase
VTGPHRLRDLESLEDYRSCVALQEEVWGRGFSERVPSAILKVAQRLGGVAAGAFQPSGRLDGFVFGLTGLDPTGEPVHWSDMLAVRAGAEGRGLATRLKAYQRDAVLARGVQRMFWTFDPLRARNAHLNLNKLGAVVREYHPDMYGDTESDLHRGIGTDRFVATWLLADESVRAKLAQALSDAPPPGVAEEGGGGEGGDDGPGGSDLGHAALTARVEQGRARPGDIRLNLEASSVTVAVPSDIASIMGADPGLAMAWRTATRAALMHYLGRGYEVRRISAGDPVAEYVLERMVG